MPSQKNLFLLLPVWSLKLFLTVLVLSNVQYLKLA